MAENLEVLNVAVSLLIRATLCNTPAFLDQWIR